MKTTSNAFLLLLPFALLGKSQFKCDIRMYDRPAIEDCAGALLSMPDARIAGSTQRKDILRHFVEPQFLEPPFAPFSCDVASQMEQLPKFWRYKTCRVALLATANTEGLVLDPAPLSSWSHVESQALKLSRNCLGIKSSGGLILIADPYGPGALTVYIYKAGSQFETVLNNYMITSKPVHPPDTLGQGANSSLTWLAANGSAEYPSAADLNLLNTLQMR